MFVAVQTNDELAVVSYTASPGLYVVPLSQVPFHIGRGPAASVTPSLPSPTSGLTEDAVPEIFLMLTSLKLAMYLIVLMR